MESCVILCSGEEYREVCGDIQYRVLRDLGEHILGFGFLCFLGSTFVLFLLVPLLWISLSFLVLVTYYQSPWPRNHLYRPLGYQLGVAEAVW